MTSHVLDKWAFDQQRRLLARARLRAEYKDAGPCLRRGSAPGTSRGKSSRLHGACTAQVIRWATAESGNYGLRPVVQLPVFSVLCRPSAASYLELPEELMLIGLVVMTARSHWRADG